MRKKTPMFNSPPSTITTPAAQRMRGPNRFSNNSGMVITPASRSGVMQNPVMPTRNNAKHERMPGVAPANPYL